MGIGAAGNKVALAPPDLISSQGSYRENSGISRQMEHESHIVCDGTSNLRDVSWAAGGHATPPGTGRVFRSANLDKLSPEGQQRFDALGIGVVIDLRGKEEAAAAPMLAGAMRVHLPIEPTVMAELRGHLAAGTLSVDTAVGVMEGTYRHYILAHSDVFAGILHHVLDAGRRPVLFHCAAGKDRTGVAAALILTALGVAPAAIMDDYLLSNRLFRPHPPTSADIPEDVRAAMIKVRPSYLDAAFATMAEGWGGPERYLEKALGIGTGERAALRAALGA
jgi:protein-tyrosine phosphatase